jgi:dephospho-CoA kinase
MLEHLGAFGIDADALSHRAISRGAPGYNKVIETFGRWLIGPDGEIDRGKLGRLVFSDPAALAQLESIIHPLVLQAVDWMVRRSNKAVIVIEAVKLLEASMHKDCDSVWVVVSPPDVQLGRLVNKRGMREAEALQRIAAQPPQEVKASAAQVVIKNAASFEDTWKQVASAWQKTMPTGVEMAPEQPVKTTLIPQGNLTVSRGRPRDAGTIAVLMNRVKKESHVTGEDIMAEFGEKAYLLVRVGNHLVGAAGWQVENLVARTSEIVLDPAVPVAQLLPPLVQEMERASKDLQCEAALVFTTSELSDDKVWLGLGYERRQPQMLGASVWQEAAKETLKPGQTMYFKQLRMDRVLRPI